MKKVNVSIVFWGTSAFAIPALQALHSAGYSVVQVVTNPDELVGREQVLTSPPLKQTAKKYKIPVFQPASLKGGEDFLADNILPADLYVVAAYGKIIPKEILAKPKLGALNIHPSLLPRWRGPAPIQATILHGDEETGVTIILLDEQMDHGPVIAAQKILLARRKPTFGKLHDELADLGANLLVEALPRWLAGQIIPTPQDNAKATFSKILKKSDGRILWDRPAEEIERMVRAFNPWPGTWTLWPSDSKIFRVRIEEADWILDEPPYGSPGFVWKNSEHSLLVKTSRGSLVITKIKIEGKKLLDAEAFMRGNAKLLETSFI